MRAVRAVEIGFSEGWQGKRMMEIVVMQRAWDVSGPRPGEIILPP
jgi:hypothetical protein